ncbi:outer membrane protein assembly factor [Flocculibacter collagenilyticus]|uniref:hypothetical protein n=1 Tax=Flocculibacter collagenilyticus TaxID=2744479 RepID=UPI0018F349C2|nr:hypothetical protein [Flocculibacter collagenilyticus]
MKIKSPNLLAYSTLSLSIIALCSLSLTSVNASAASVFVSAGQTELSADVGEKVVNFKPRGSSLSMSFEPSENWSLNVYLSQYSDDADLTLDNSLPTQADYNEDSYGLSTTYFNEQWSYQLGYSVYQDDLILSNRKHEPFKEDTRAPSYFGSVGYSWIGEDSNSSPFGDTTLQSSTYHSISAGLQYSDWEQHQVRFAPPQHPPRLMPPQSFDNKGNNLYVDLSYDFSLYNPLSSDAGIVWGAALSWHYLISGESNLIAINGRSINQIVSRLPKNSRTTNFINSTRASSSGSSYGVVASYISFELNKNWTVEFEVSSSIAGDNDTQAGSISVGYTF